MMVVVADGSGLGFDGRKRVREPSENGGNSERYERGGGKGESSSKSRPGGGSRDRQASRQAGRQASRYAGRQES